MAILQQAQGLIGIALILLLAWGISENRGAMPGWKWIVGALVMQVAIALAFLQIPLVWRAVGMVNQGVSAIETATLAGSSYMFGYLGGAALPFTLKPGVAPPTVMMTRTMPR